MPAAYKPLYRADDDDNIIIIIIKVFAQQPNPGSTRP